MQRALQLILLLLIPVIYGVSTTNDVVPSATKTKGPSPFCREFIPTAAPVLSDLGPARITLDHTCKRRVPCPLIPDQIKVDALRPPYGLMLESWQISQSRETLMNMMRQPVNGTTSRLPDKYKGSSDKLMGYSSVIDQYRLVTGGETPNLDDRPPADLQNLVIPPGKTSFATFKASCLFVQGLATNCSWTEKEETVKGKIGGWKDVSYWGCYPFLNSDDELVGSFGIAENEVPGNDNPKVGEKMIKDKNIQGTKYARSDSNAEVLAGLTWDSWVRADAEAAIS